MRERVELLVGRATRAMWVMTFHSACARMLRADAQRLGYTRQFTIYDSADQRRLIKKCLDDLDIDPKRFTPRAMQVQISDAKNKLRAADDYRGMVGSFFEQTVADVYEAYERELHRANAMDFDDLLFRAVNLLELFQEVRDRYPNAFRWILVDEYQDTNHAQYRWLQLLTRRAPQPRGGRRRRSVDLQLPRRRHHQHPQLRGRLRRRPRRPARAELPLDADDPERRERGRGEQPRAQGQVALDRDRRGRPDQGARARRRARGGALRRRGDRAARRRGRVARRARRLLPHERAVARARGHARARADRLPGDRRDEVLRARGDQGRGRVPHVPRQPGGRRRVHADRELAQARDRPDVALARARARGHDGHLAVGGRRGAGGRAVAGHGGAQGDRALHVDDGAAGRARGRPARRSPSCSRRRCARPATSRRSRPSGRSRRRAGSRTSRSSCASRASTTGRPGRARTPAWPSSCSRSRCSPTPTRSATTRAS